MRNLKHPAFERRHYDRIALVLFNYQRDHVAINPNLVTAFVATFKADNPRFMPERFREAVQFGYGIGVPRPRPPRKSRAKKKATANT